MSKHASDFAGLPVEPVDENALLRAALADAHRRIGEMERDGFRAELERVLRLAERHGTFAALVGIALPGLAALGEGRDAALAQVAGLLGGLIRSTDILARTGEDRFDLILDHIDLDSAIDTAERLARCVAAHPPALKAVVATTGIMPGDRVEEVLARAERNLAAAKAEA